MYIIQHIHIYHKYMFFQVFSSFTFQKLSQKSPIPCPPTPLPTHSHFLTLVFLCTRAYKVCQTKAPLFTMMTDEAIFFYICSSRQELWGYWLVHIVVPSIGLQTPSAPWVLSLAPPLGEIFILKWQPSLETPDLSQHSAAFKCQVQLSALPATCAITQSPVFSAT